MQHIVSRYYSSYDKDLLLMHRRDRLFRAYKQLNPDGVQYRLRRLERTRGEYITPGPNFLWSIDQHSKLEHWGIEIYAAIDAFSRHVIWIYVGITARTAISCYKQYVIQWMRLEYNLRSYDQTMVVKRQ
jgi:hypothetical protein